MLQASTARARRFSRDKRGNVAILFGLAIVPLVLFVGLAVDYGRAMTVRGAMSQKSL